jgi:predicted transposase/invertase (TIGR01784 family)
MERFNPLNDYLFLKIMGEKGDEEQCLAFLNAVLSDSGDEPLRLVKILENRSISAETLGDKSSVLDFRALAETVTKKDIKLDIEVQIKNIHNMTERTLYYWAREYVSGIKKGGDYSGIPPVTTINIVNFDHVKLDSHHTVHRLREDKHPGHILTNMIQIHFLSMNTFRKKSVKDINNTLERWLMFLDENTSPDTLAEIIEMDPAIAKAQRRLEEVTQDDEVWHNYTLRMMALSDWTTGINTAFEQGIEEGRTEGERIGRRETAKSLKALGLSAEKIAASTRLSLEEIDVL